MQFFEFFVSCELLVAGKKFLDLLVHLLRNDSIHLLFVLGVDAQQLDLMVSVCSEAVALFLLPGLDERLYCVEGVSFFIVCELSVLAHSVQADNKLLFDALIRLEFNFFPDLLIFVFGLLLSRCLSLFLEGALFRLVGFTFLVLFFSASHHILVVSYRGFKCFISQARVVDHWNCHIGSEAGHFLELDPWFAHYFSDVNVSERVDDIVGLGLGLTFFSFFAGSLFGFFLGASHAWILEDVMGDALVGLKDSVDDVFVCRRSGVQELDDLSGFVVKVSVFICLFIDSLLWVAKLTDIATSGARVLLKESRELLEVVSKVRRLLDASKELGLLLLFGFLSLFLLLFIL